MLLAGLISQNCIEFLYSANDMKIFIVLSESPLGVKKIAFYHFLISFQFPELLRFKGAHGSYFGCAQ